MNSNGEGSSSMNGAASEIKQRTEELRERLQHLQMTEDERVCSGPSSSMARLKLGRTPNEEHLIQYLPDSERILKHREYRNNILSSYQRLHGEIYSLDPASFFMTSFLYAVSQASSEGRLKSLIVQHAVGIYSFQMLQPSFCEMLLAEVEHMERWVIDSKSTIMRANTMNRFGVVLDDFGFETMLQKLVDDFISPISQVLFPEVCGSGLDSHHGYIVEYGKDRDTDIGFHVDDSEVTLNVCLGKQFSGGELYFQGVRCDNHVNSEIGQKESHFYQHVPGQAVLHLGRHRHGARATTNGHRANLILWCTSSTFRGMKSYQRDFSSWCGGCKDDRQKRQKVIESSHEMGIDHHGEMVQARALSAELTYQLTVGQEFPDVNSCRRALRDMASALHFQLQTIKSDTTRFIAKCSSQGCPWRVYAAKLPGVPTFTIRTINESHSCGARHQQHSTHR